jgi:hypothetical protein
MTQILAHHTLHQQEGTIMSAAFIKAALERAIKTFAQALVALISVNATGVLDVDWKGGLSAAALAAVVSILTSIGSDWATGNGPSLTNAEIIGD